MTTSAYRRFVSDNRLADSILAAAAQGKKFIRQGNAFFRVDRELVAGCRKKLEEAAGQSGSGFDAASIASARKIGSRFRMTNQRSNVQTVPD